MNEATKSEVRSFLRSVRSARLERRQAERSLELLRTEAERITASFSLAGGGGGDAHRDALLIELADRGKELEGVIRRQWAREREVEGFINQLPDERHRAVLRLRYVECLSWPKVLAGMQAVGLWYEERQMFRLHGAALREARKLWERKAEDNG